MPDTIRPVDYFYTVVPDKPGEGFRVLSELKRAGILVRTPSPGALAEEASIAYKDVADVVEVCERAGIARKVARLRPRVVVKG